MKVMTIVGTRPEVIKLSRVIAELDKHVKHVLVHTGQNYDHELNGIFFEEMGLRSVDYQLSCFGTSPMVQIGTMLQSVSVLLEREAPDAVLILGDTNSCVAAAYAAKRRHIPIFHMEAGNRCFDQRVPEEVNRKIVDHISDINMPYTEHARRNLLAEGIPADRIIKTGSPMREVINAHMHEINAVDPASVMGFKPYDYFVVSAHREENVDNPDRLRMLVRTVDNLAALYCLPVVVSLHPRTKRRLEEQGIGFAPHVVVTPPLGFFSYVALQITARCVVSDSGTITEESALLGFPAVTIRQAHERPEGSDEGTLIMADLNPRKVADAVKVAIGQKNAYFASPVDYSSELVSMKVVRTILSYTDYVQRVVWRRS